MHKAKLFELDGEEKTLKEWAEIYKIPVTNLRTRMCSNGSWTLKRALTTPINASRVSRAAPAPSALAEKHAAADAKIEQAIRALREKVVVGWSERWGPLHSSG